MKFLYESILDVAGLKSSLRLELISIDLLADVFGGPKLRRSKYTDC